MGFSIDGGFMKHNRARRYSELKGNAAPGVVRAKRMLGADAVIHIVRSDHAALVLSDDVCTGACRQSCK
ncbi:hypothetical protein PU99_11065 [Pseudomonas putida]|nr:hypothetical protein PU99_11065 [Pseudomonas putida]